MGALLAGGAGAPRAPATIRVLSSLETTRPRNTPLDGAARAAVLSAARGEWESFQIVVRAGAHPLAALEATAPLLRGPRGAQLTLRLQRVGFIDVKTPSNVEGAPGPWPDPLLPDSDDETGERRGAFPVHVEAGADATLWVDAYVPGDALPGDYRGAVRLRDGARPLGEVAVALRVRRFGLPPSSSLPVTFGFSARSAARGLLGREPTGDEALALSAVFSRAALRHRISLHGGTFEAPPCVPRPGGGVAVDFTRYDADVGPFLDGGAGDDRRGLPRGARFSAIDVRAPDCPPAWRAEGLRATLRHLEERGWRERAFTYVADEPPATAFDAVERSAGSTLAATGPVLRRLVTTAPSPRLPSVDLFCPPLYLVDRKPAPTPLDALAPVEPGQDRGGLWWYQSCLSHGCDGVGDGYFAGWPSLAIDAPPVGHRVLEWLTFAEGVGGELYYNTVEAWSDGDPWIDGRRHGGNGDGTLFYPGRPERIGGRTPIPVESIRLRRIRDGLEYYEYLALLLRAGPAGRSLALSVARALAPRAYSFDHDPRALLAARARLAAAIEALLAAAEGAGDR